MDKHPSLSAEVMRGIEESFASESADAFEEFCIREARAFIAPEPLEALRRVPLAAYEDELVGMFAQASMETEWQLAKALYCEVFAFDNWQSELAFCDSFDEATHEWVFDQIHRIRGPAIPRFSLLSVDATRQGEWVSFGTDLAALGRTLASLLRAYSRATVDRPLGASLHGSDWTLVRKPV